MLIRFLKFIFLRFGILSLLVGFSSVTFADFYWKGAALGANQYPSYLVACQAMTPGVYVPASYVYSGQTSVVASDQYGPTTVNCVFSTPAGATRSLDRYGAPRSCPAGQTPDVNNQCACPSGQVLENGSCQVICASGTTRDVGTIGDIVNGVPASCRTPSQYCQHRSGTSYQALGMTNAINGCTVSCAVVVGSGAFPISCTYSGATAGPADGPNDENTSPELEPPEEITPAPPNDFCPAGTDEGFVNGGRYCAPRTKANGQPNVATVPTSPNVQTQITTSTSTTMQNPNGSTTVTTITNTIGGGSSGSGSGDGTGGDSGISRDYANGDYSQWFNTSEVDQQIEEAKTQFVNDFADAKNSLSSSMSLAGASGLPSFGPANVLGKSISFNLADYSSQLSVIAQAVIFISLMVSAYIVLKR